MKRLVLLVGAMTLAGTFAVPAFAGGADKNGQFYATPIQKGAPRDLPGEQLVPGAPLIVDTIDAVVKPIVVDPIQTAGASLTLPVLPGLEPAPAAAPAAAPMMRHRHHHHMMMRHHHMAMKHHMMMKHHHKMMMKKKM